MPLPTAPVKLGNLLPSEEYKAKARPARPSRKQASEGDLATTDIDTDFAAPASASRPTAANALRAIASETLANAAKGSAVEASDAAPAARTRRTRQTAALLQP
nr:PhoH family protein [Pseudomonadota bacterium]